MDEAGLRAQIKRLIVTEWNLQGPDTKAVEKEMLGIVEKDLRKAYAIPAKHERQDAVAAVKKAALQLAMAIEDKLGALIPAGDEARSIFKSVRSIAEYVAKVRSA